ncbi:outer membrane beta-barrel family protein [Adhaeribacter aquaticus]|uniref:outer membrane beta-barrel family protein n=1 Tax=Adhaeribacter aquaticus TaxID=299567 RepID=UPI0003F68F8E|nr:outer membrane beta-barrel family protein [Adhaeribacter aquaticus]
MKKILFLLLAGFLSIETLQAQTPTQKSSNTPQPAAPPDLNAIPALQTIKGNGKIAGIIQDETTKSPIEFATITLLLKATGKAVDGAISDEKGKFSIIRVPPGEYRVSISFIGYETKFLENIQVSKDKNEVNLGAITVKSDAKLLKEVSVTGERPLVEEKVDRMVYNAEKDISNISGNAADVLKKVPGLTVDLEGNVQLRGSSNIRVLINNKPSSIMAGSIAEALRQIPSEQIKSVEIITSPSAKYDAEGTAGIINIITKKNNLQGLTGNVNLSYGTRNSNANGNINYRKSKWGFNSSMGLSRGNNPGRMELQTIYKNNDQIDKVTQLTTGRQEGTFKYMQFGTDYEINKRNTLSAGIRLNDPNFTIKSTQIASTINNDQISAFQRRNNSQMKGSIYDLNFEYTKTFAKPQQELSFLGLYSKNNRDNLMHIDQWDMHSSLLFRERNVNFANNEEITFQTDYTQPFPKNAALEIGAKTIIRNAHSDIQYNRSANEGPFLPNKDAPNDKFDYNQRVVASYATYSFNLNKKYSFKIGSRYEYTNIKANFLLGKASIPDYGNLIPSISIARDLPKNQKLRLNYTQRIQRPQLYFLNPYENRTDSLYRQVGNPFLRAELSHSYELNYSTFFKGTTLNAALFWRQTNNAIEAYVPEPVNKIVYTTFGNLGRNGSYGLTLFGNSRFLKKGNISSNLNLFYMNMSSQALNINRGSFMYNGNINASWQFPKGLSMQVFGYYNSPRLTLQGKSAAFNYNSLALKKELFNKKGSISAGVDNPFNKTIRQRTYSSTQAVDFQNTLYVYNRQLRVSFNYQFGKMDFKNQPRRKKRINNDDAKSGGDAATGGQ